MPAIVDTGADATVVPLRYLLEIGAEETAPGWLRGVAGDRRPVALYFVDVHVGELRFPNVRVIGDKLTDDLLLGRDVLNKLALFLDGPMLQFYVVDEAAAKQWRARQVR
ncbi:MAG: retroviral-like aspartic protease family protein [Chloroflexota bacterium]